MIVVLQRNSHMIENTGCPAGVEKMRQNTIKEGGDLAGKKDTFLSGYEINSGGEGLGVGVDFLFSHWDK